MSIINPAGKLIYFRLLYIQLPEMKIIFLLIAISLMIALCFLGAFFWAVRSGQFDDDFTPSVRMLFDDNDPDVKK